MSFIKKKKSNKKKRSIWQTFLTPAVFISFIIVSMSVCLMMIFFLGEGASQSKEEMVVVDEKSEFVKQLVPYAQELQGQYGVLPSIILGQAILESNWGTSQLASQYYNLFGIKASEGENKVHLTTKEYVNEEWIETTGNFKVYTNWKDSMTDHTLLFVNGVSWNHDLYKPVLEATNFRDAAVALQTAGYATDPDYAEKIIQVIEAHNLTQYD